MAVTVQLLGPLAVVVDGTAVPADSFRRKRALDLLRRLALAPGHTLHREELVDALWPDKDLEAGANNLHRAVHDLRQVLGDRRVLIDKGLVRLAADVQVDVAAFERAIAAGDLARAVDLYHGDLCPEDPYDESLGARREGLRQRFVDVALRLVREQEQAGDPEAAIATGRRLVDIDPGREDAHRVLMRALARAGRRQDALRHFAACTRALREHLDAAPSAETLRLRAEILRGDIAPLAGAAEGGWRRIAQRLIGGGAAAPLRGRGPALAEIGRFVDGGEGVLLLLGEAGVGKTRMVVEALRLAERAGAVVLCGGGSDLGEGIPYQAFVEAWREAGVADIPFLAPHHGQDAKLELYRSVEASLHGLAGGRRVLLVLEDLHWLDDSSVHLFHYLARASGSAPWQLLATGREEEVAPGSTLQALILSLKRERLLRPVLLERLDRAATAEQLADLLGGPPSPDVVDSTWALSAGNPFFTEEIVRSRVAGDAAVPADLAETVRARVVRLGASVQELLQAAAVLGSRFRFDVAAEAGGLAEAAALDALEAALGTRLVEEDGPGYRFRHALVRESLYGGLSRPRRALLHRAAAAVLERRTPEAHEELAHHHRESGNARAALPHLVAGGQRAARRQGLREAVAAFEEALAVMDELGLPPGPDWFDLLDRCGRARLALSDIAACVADFDRAAALVGPDGWRPSAGERARAWRLASLALLTGGQLEPARARLEQAVAVLAAHGDDHEWPNVLYHLAQLHWHEGDHRAAYETAERSLAAAERDGDPEAIARGYEMLALACHTLGEWKEGLHFEERRQQLVGAPVDVAQSFDVHL